jgi:hypothetical protein
MQEGRRLHRWEKAAEASVRGREGFGRKRRSGEKGSKGLFDHRWGEKLWRVMPKSVGS